MATREVNLGDLQMGYGSEPNILPALKANLGADLRIGPIKYSPQSSLEEEERQVVGRGYDPEEEGFFSESDLRMVRAVISDLIKEFEISKPISSGVELGAGPLGLMVERYMTPYINKETWTQVEANPLIVAENKRRHPRSHVRQLPHSRVHELGPKKMLAGVDALTETYYLPEVLDRLALGLENGGYLLHLVTGRASVKTGLSWMNRNQFESPHRAVFIRGREIAPFYYQNPTNKSLTSGPEAFRQNIAYAIARRSDMRMLLNQWVEVKRRLNLDEESALESMGVKIGTNLGDQRLAMVVTLAQRI